MTNYKGKILTSMNKKLTENQYCFFTKEGCINNEVPHRFIKPGKPKKNENMSVGEGFYTVVCCFFGSLVLNRSSSGSLPLR